MPAGSRPHRCGDNEAHQSLDLEQSTISRARLLGKVLHKGDTRKRVRKKEKNKKYFFLTHKIKTILVSTSRVVVGIK